MAEPETDLPEVPFSERIYIDAMALRLDRAVHTLRQWIREAEKSPADAQVMPANLLPLRQGGRGKIYWTEEQARGLERYAADRAARVGWGGARRSS